MFLRGFLIMVLKSMKLAAVFMFCLFGTMNAFAQDESGATAKQIVEKFQAELIAVMKDGKQLGYAGRYAKLTNRLLIAMNLQKLPDCRW
jgi:phospholipid transport system substrate-binding protein